MYTVSCDGYPLLDTRDDDLMLFSPKVKVEVNTVGSGSFTIYDQHPYFGKLSKLKSIFEVRDEIGVIFRGRMTSDSKDFYNGKDVDLEGVMAFFNDSIVRPYSFPDDFLEDADYITASESGNVIEFFLNWLITQHNEQVQEFQRFKLGRVTVTDPNNYLSRSDSNYPNTWNVLKSKLFGSELGGFFCIRYEDDGNYIDYLSEFELTNTQDIVFGENLLDLMQKNDASETYSAVLPIGAEIDVGTGETDDDGNAIIEKQKLTLSDLDDGNITDDIVKSGDILYSKSAVEAYGFILAPIADTTWSDVTDVNNLLTKAVSHLSTDAIMLSEIKEISACDLHFSDSEIQSFRIYRKQNVFSAPHGLSEVYNLTKLEIPLLNPQNTKITVGATTQTLTEINSQQQSEAIERIQSAEKDIAENRTGVSEAKQMTITQSTEAINTCTEILFSALESYVETGNFEEYKETVSTQLSIMAGEIVAKFTTATSQITDVDGDLQEKFNQLYKFIEMSDNGITISSGDSQIELQLDNEAGIVFSKNGTAFGRWDGVNFYTGNIVVEVTERAQFGNFAFIPRSDGSLMLLKVGG